MVLRRICDRRWNEGCDESMKERKIKVVIDDAKGWQKRRRMCSV